MKLQALSWCRLPEGHAACIAHPAGEPLPDLKGRNVTIDGKDYTIAAVVPLYRDARRKRRGARVALVVDG